MISIHNSKLVNIQKKYIQNINVQRSSALSKLNSLNIIEPAGANKNYLENVINLFTNNIDFLTWDMSKISIYKDNLGAIPSIEIKNKILTALGYKNLRTSFYPKYFNDIGIKACVYCNSQLTITTNGKNAKFDVDHYHSKDDYPFLSISLFNLYPSCASCNRLKSTKKVKFELYTDEINKTKKSDFKFKLETNGKAKYLTTKNKEYIEFRFEEPIYPMGFKKFNDVFHIEGIYKTQLDLIEELIIKSQIYNQSYLKTLKKNFSNLNLQPELFKRMIVGNFTEDKDIHKRPMSKFVMDIAKELGLIKKIENV
jgi:hypothetical protein